MITLPRAAQSVYSTFLTTTSKGIVTTTIITLQAIRDVLEAGEHDYRCKFGMDSWTDINGLKGGKGNPHVGNIKVLSMGLTGTIYTTQKGYENDVNRARVANGNDEPFVSKPLPYGQWVDNSPFIVTDAGEFQLRTAIENCESKAYFLRGSDGDYTEIKKADIIGLDTDLEYECGCDDKKTHWVSFANYLAMTHGGKADVKVFKQPFRAIAAELTGNTRAKSNDWQQLGGEHGSDPVRPSNYGKGGVENVLLRLAAFKQVIS